MAPALGGFSPNGKFGGMGDKPAIPQAFFSMEEEEIVALLVASGYSERVSRADAAKFMEYKERQTTPPQEWSDDGTPAEEVPPEKVTQRLSSFVDQLKGRSEK